MSRAEFYRLVSAAIRRVRDRTLNPEVLAGSEVVARELAHDFAQHNEKFDAVRFMRDCGLE